MPQTPFLRSKVTKKGKALTDRERVILQRYAKGASPADIGRSLMPRESAANVNTALRAICSKLGTKNDKDLAVYVAQQEGII